MGSAAAEPEAHRPQAEAKLAQAHQLYEAGDYQGSLERLNEAYALVPSPKILFNFGLAYQALGRDVEALDAFERFLAEISERDQELAAERKEAMEQVERLKSRVATVEIVADLAGAEVVIDGRSRGHTPLLRPLRVAPGPHQVVIQKPGLASPYIDRIEVVPGQLLLLRPRLMLLAPSTAPEGARPAAPPLYRRWWLWGAAGAVIAAGVTGIVLASSGGGGGPRQGDPVAVFHVGGMK